MNSRRSQAGTPVNLYKKLKEEQRDELCRLHQNYRMHVHTLSTEYKAKYKTLLTQEERAVLLTTFVQLKTQFRSAYNLKHKRLLIQQSEQLENMFADVSELVELHKCKRIKTARTIIEAAIQSGTLCIIQQV